MPLITKNIVVGVSTPTTPTKKEESVPAPRFQVLGNFVNLSEPEKPVAPPVPEKKPTTIVQNRPHIIHKEDGELIRKINLRSPYMRDMLEDL
jgi:hypothetical protein